MQQESKNKQIIKNKKKHVTFAIDDEIHIVKCWKNGGTSLWYSPFELKKIERHVVFLCRKMEVLPSSMIEIVFGDTTRGLEPSTIFIQEKKSFGFTRKKKGERTLQERLCSAVVAMVVWALNYNEYDEDKKRKNEEEHARKCILAHAYMTLSENAAKTAIQRAAYDKKFVDKEKEYQDEIELMEEQQALIVGRHIGLTMPFAVMGC